MKRLFFLILSFFFLISPHLAFADGGWVIENFHSDIAIQDSGKVRVVETISADFRNEQKHGIYRDIPYEYESDGKKTYTEVTIESVVQNNEDAKYSVSETNGYKELKIGDANKLLTGRNVYTITYTVTGVLRGFGDHDELYWNVTGDKWDVFIHKADAIVTLPKEAITQITCFEGVSGSQAPCASKLASPQLATFSTSGMLGSSEGLTVAVAYKKGAIPLLTAKPPKTFFEKLISWESLMTILTVFLIGFVTLAALWYRKGRDFWFAGNLFGTKAEKGKAKPIGAHETVSVEFVPPENLRPAEMGVLMDERADTLDVVATIIDLASRGYLTITEVPKKWLFGKVDYLLTKTTPKTRRKSTPLLAYEQLLLDKLFFGRTQIKTSSLKQTFYKDLEEVKQALYDNVITKGFFSENPEKVRGKYKAAGFILLFIIFFVITYSTSLLSIFWDDLLIGAGLIGVLLLLQSRFMPRKTAYGREMLRRSKGYYLFVNQAEKYRQRFFEKKNMFNEIMPYAIMFGLTKKFAQQMHEMGIEPSQTGWYVSPHPFNAGVFASNMTSFSSSMSSAIASAPSSSGGFSGGSSGGGFGGGGGGSW